MELVYSRGTDISKWQDRDDTPVMVDFNKMESSEADFVYIKASQGKTVDPDFQSNRANARKTNLPIGFYHFLVWSISGKEQARFFWELVKDDAGELPLVCDFEQNPGIPTPITAKLVLRDFLEELSRLSGKTLMIYTGAFFWAQFGDRNPYWGKYLLWLASYSTQSYMEENLKKYMPQWETWTFWQYSAKGDGAKYGAESKQIDLNYYNGTTKELKEWVMLDEKDMELLKDAVEQAMEKAMKDWDEVISKVHLMTEDLKRLNESMDELLKSLEN